MSVLMVEDTSCSACDVDCVTDKYRLANLRRRCKAQLRGYENKAFFATWSQQEQGALESLLMLTS